MLVCAAEDPHAMSKLQAKPCILNQINGGTLLPCELTRPLLRIYNKIKHFDTIPYAGILLYHSIQHFDFSFPLCTVGGFQYDRHIVKMRIIHETFKELYT